MTDELGSLPKGHGYCPFHSVLWKPPAPLLFGAGQGFHKKTSYYGTTHSVRLANTEKTYPFHLEQERCGSPSFLKEVRSTYTYEQPFRCIWKIRGDRSLLENGRSLPGQFMGPIRSLHMEPTPLPVLMDSSSEGLAPDAPPRLAAEGRRSSTRSTVRTLWSSFSIADPKPEPLGASTRLR